MLLSDFDPSPISVINPDMVIKKIPDFPDTIVSVFEHRLFDKLVAFLGGVQIGTTHDVDGYWYVYRAEYKGVPIALAKARCGAPACVGKFEEVLAMGGKRIILLGNCGVLDRRIRDCGIILPTAALRDEGTSYHYAPPSDLIPVNRKYRELFRQTCEEYGYPVTEGTTWTTDAFYRETPYKAAARKAQGAICVEMECSAMQAMCDFRDVEFFQFFYAGDNLDRSEWQPRSLSGTARLDDKEKIALLAAEFAVRIAQAEAS